MTCPYCGGPGDRSLYLGLPVRYCDAGHTGGIFGRWAWLAQHLPVDAIRYGAGGYWPALAQHLAGRVRGWARTLRGRR